MSTVSVCMICKNEISNIGILLDQICPVVEQVVIVDTGSTDGTLEVLEHKQGMYSNLQVEHFKWVEDFSKARNYSFSFATQDYILFLDCDDQIDSEALNNFKNNELNDPEVDCWILDYVYSSFPDGTPQMVLGRERFVRRSLNPKWIGAIHETIGIWGFRQKTSDKLKVIHNRNGKVIDYDRNIRILASEFEKDPKDARTAYYYGKELFDRVDPKGLEVLKHYLTLEGKYWDDVVNAQFRLACDDLVNNRLDEAYNRASQIYILDTSRERAEYYWLMGSIEQKILNYKSAIRWYNMCLDLNPESPRVVNKEYYTWNPLMRISECYLALGDINNVIERFDKLVNQVGKPATEKLRKEIVAYFKPINGLVIFDYLKIRSDSYHLTTRSDKLGEFVDGIIDEVYIDSMSNLLKPKGFYWHLRDKGRFDDSCQTISKETYMSSDSSGAEIYNSIKVEQSLPYFYIPEGDTNFGPYRIRLRNLRNSLIKNGYKVYDHNPKSAANCIFISNRLEQKYYTHNILDVCEWLPESDYSSFGIQHADLVVCSSPLLADLMQTKFPNKKVTCVEDHVDMVDREWL